MTCSCASAIVAEMNDWIRLGGANSGCCGNSAHTYGFHRAANEIPVTDYSRSHEAARPYNMSWACAGDFHHGYNPRLMQLHANLLTALMQGKYPMICEMITKPWANRPVYYWARWDGNSTLQRYTGSGHDHWSHISWWRSKANQRAYLWSAGSGGGGSVTPTPGTSAPAYPGYVLRENPNKIDANVRTWQGQAKARGASVTADGYFGAQTLGVVKAFQHANGYTVDGEIGPVTWSGMWNLKTKIK